MSDDPSLLSSLVHILHIYTLHKREAKWGEREWRMNYEDCLFHVIPAVSFHIPHILPVCERDGKQDGER